MQPQLSFGYLLWFDLTMFERIGNPFGGFLFVRGDIPCWLVPLGGKSSAFSWAAVERCGGTVWRTMRESAAPQVERYVVSTLDSDRSNAVVVRHNRIADPVSSHMHLRCDLHFVGIGQSGAVAMQKGVLGRLCKFANAMGLGSNVETVQKHLSKMLPENLVYKDRGYPDAEAEAYRLAVFEALFPDSQLTVAEARRKALLMLIFNGDLRVPGVVEHYGNISGLSEVQVREALQDRVPKAILPKPPRPLDMHRWGKDKEPLNGIARFCVFNGCGPAAFLATIAKTKGGQRKAKSAIAKMSDAARDGEAAVHALSDDWWKKQSERVRSTAVWFQPGGSVLEEVTRLQLILRAPGRLIARLFTIGSEKWQLAQQEKERAGGYRELRIVIAASGVLGIGFLADVKWTLTEEIALTTIYGHHAGKTFESAACLYISVARETAYIYRNVIRRHQMYGTRLWLGASRHLPASLVKAAHAAVTSDKDCVRGGTDSGPNRFVAAHPQLGEHDPGAAILWSNGLEMETHMHMVEREHGQTRRREGIGFSKKPKVSKMGASFLFRRRLRRWASVFCPLRRPNGTSRPLLPIATDQSVGGDANVQTPDQERTRKPARPRACTVNRTAAWRAMQFVETKRRRIRGTPQLLGPDRAGGALEEQPLAVQHRAAVLARCMSRNRKGALARQGPQRGKVKRLRLFFARGRGAWKGKKYWLTSAERRCPIRQAQDAAADAARARLRSEKAEEDSLKEAQRDSAQLTCPTLQRKLEKFLGGEFASSLVATTQHVLELFPGKADSLVIPEAENVLRGCGEEAGRVHEDEWLEKTRIVSEDDTAAFTESQPVRVLPCEAAGFCVCSPDKIHIQEVRNRLVARVEELGAEFANSGNFVLRIRFDGPEAPQAEQHGNEEAGTACNGCCRRFVTELPPIGSVEEHTCVPGEHPWLVPKDEYWLHISHVAWKPRVEFEMMELEPQAVDLVQRGFSGIGAVLRQRYGVAPIEDDAGARMAEVVEVCDEWHVARFIGCRENVRVRFAKVCRMDRPVTRWRKDEIAVEYVPDMDETLLWGGTAVEAAAAAERAKEKAAAKAKAKATRRAPRRSSGQRGLPPGPSPPLEGTAEEEEEEEEQEVEDDPGLQDEINCFKEMVKQDRHKFMPARPPRRRPRKPLTRTQRRLVSSDSDGGSDLESDPDLRRQRLGERGRRRLERVGRGLLAGPTSDEEDAEESEDDKEETDDGGSGAAPDPPPPASQYSMIGGDFTYWLSRTAKPATCHARSCQDKRIGQMEFRLKMNRTSWLAVGQSRWNG